MKARIPWNGSKKDREILQAEVKRQMVEVTREHADNIDALVLYILHDKYGFGKKRLKRFFDTFSDEMERLEADYMMPGDAPFICTTKLKSIGVDVAEWNKQRRELQCQMKQSQ